MYIYGYNVYMLNVIEYERNERMVVFNLTQLNTSYVHI